MNQPHQTRRFKEALARVQQLFMETPGLKLTTADAALMAGLDRQVCRVLLGELTDAGFLEHQPGGLFVRRLPGVKQPSPWRGEIVKKVPTAPRAAPRRRKTDIASPVSVTTVRDRAYSLFQARGGEHGHDVEDWLRAESELLTGNTTTTASPFVEPLRRIG